MSEAINSLVNLSNALADLVETAGGSIVRVEGRNRMPATGVVYSNEGVVVTAHHVVERDDNLVVGLPNGESVAAQLVGRDPGTDLAVLRVTGAMLDAPQWVDAGELRPGNLALALGRPGRSVQAVLGLLTAAGGAYRTSAGGEVDRYLQSDIVMYPGFSGGPLVAADGRFAGINSSALARGASLSIPAATVKRVADTILQHGHMPRGYLGIGIQPVRLDAELQAELGQQTGLMLMSVETNGPAAQAGLLQGDVLVSVAGQPMRQMDDLQGLLTSGLVGKSLAVRFVRAGAVHEASAVVGQK
jgi:S1-C subfamily serine protease